MARNMDDVRAALFAALDGLSDKDNPLDIERAQAISEVAQVIINSAKVEVEHLKISGGRGSKFLGADDAPQLPGVRIVTHRLK
jgi:hypothetical protein